MGLSACAEWILSFVQEIAGVKTDPQGCWSTKHILFPSFLVCKAKLVLPKTETKKTCLGHWTVCMRWLDLEPCTRDSRCKTWSTEELVHQPHSLPGLLGLWSRDWSSLKHYKSKKTVLAMELYACGEWFLNFLQEIAGVRSDLGGSWSTKHILFLSFLSLWSKKENSP